MYGAGPSINKYGPVSTNQSPYGNNTSNGYRGTQNSSEGNLHLSGYGPHTTQPEIIALFSPYVQVREVVMKGTFCFVNTDDATMAKQAREALNGALLGGAPIRINMAQRKNVILITADLDLLTMQVPVQVQALIMEIIKLPELQILDILQELG